MRECHEVPRLPRKTTLQLALTHWSRIGFAASPIDTQRPQENQRLETRHVGASKRAFRAKLPQIFTLSSFKIDVLLCFTTSFLMNLKVCYLKIDVLCEASVNFQHISQNSTPATEIARCHHLRQPGQCDSQKPRNTTPPKCCACQAKWRRTRPKCCACHENCNSSSENVAKILRLPHKTTFDTFSKHVWMSRSATPATRNEATRRLKPPKVTPFAKLTIGTAIRASRERVRTVADGCERLGNVERTHPQPPDPQSETGTVATHLGNTYTHIHVHMYTCTNVHMYIYYIYIYIFYLYLYLYSYNTYITRIVHHQKPEEQTTVKNVCIHRVVSTRCWDGYGLQGLARFLPLRSDEKNPEINWSLENGMTPDFGTCGVPKS